MATEERQEGVQLQRYRAHKIVSAAKIDAVTIRPKGDAVLHFESGQAINVSPDYVLKHAPKVGGYYVIYSDGYESWSPAKAFEDGYTPVQKTNLFRLDEETVARLEKWAAAEGDGGWQGLCAKVIAGRVTAEELKRERLAFELSGLRQARRLIEDLIIAKESNDE